MAGLSMFCKLDKPEFIGKEALAAQKAEGVKQKVVGIELSDRAIPRHGYKVLHEGEEIGEVTTGYHTISSDKSVCMALIDARFAKLGTELEIQIRKKTFPGVVVWHPCHTHAAYLRTPLRSPVCAPLSAHLIIQE